MYKECTIVMLPTVRTSNNTVIYKEFWEGGSIFFHPTYKDDCIPQHLYVLSNENIKINQPYFTSDKRIVYWNKDLDEAFKGIDLKRPNPIIASTDSFIGWSNLGTDEDGRTIGNHIIKGNGCIFKREFPGLPDEFLQEYCKNGGFNKVLVEYEEAHSRPTTYDQPDIYYPEKIKVIDNNIIIKEFQPKMYSEEEVVNLILKYHNKLMKTNLGKIFEIPFTEWWEQNK